MTTTGDVLTPPATHGIDLALSPTITGLPGFDRPMAVNTRDVPLLCKAPWVRTLGKLAMEVMTQGWRFPTPEEPDAPVVAGAMKIYQPPAADESEVQTQSSKSRTRLKPPGDMVVFKDRLLYLLQPPLEDIFAGKQVRCRFRPTRIRSRASRF